MNIIPCFNCHKDVEVKDRNAIAKLCTECDTPENRERMMATPIRQHLRNIDEALAKKMAELKGEYDGNFSKVDSDISLLADKIESLKTQITQQEETTESTIKEVVEQQDSNLNLNEYGEIV